MTLPGLKVFLLVIAFWVKAGDGTEGLQGFNESHAFATQGDCLEARDAAKLRVPDLTKNGLVAYYISDCINGDMTLVGDKDANVVK